MHTYCFGIISAPTTVHRTFKHSLISFATRVGSPAAPATRMINLPLPTKQESDCCAKRTALPQAWHASNVSPPGRSRRIASRNSTSPFRACCCHSIKYKSTNTSRQIQATKQVVSSAPPATCLCSMCRHSATPAKSPARASASKQGSSVVSVGKSPMSII